MGWLRLWSLIQKTKQQIKCYLLQLLRRMDLLNHEMQEEKEDSRILEDHVDEWLVVCWEEIQRIQKIYGIHNKWERIVPLNFKKQRKGKTE